MARRKLERLTEQMYYVLLSLWEEPRHGYGIMQFAARLTEGRVSIGAGTLYALLGRFESEGLIRCTDTSAVRKYYILTDEGKRVLREEYQRLTEQVKHGSHILEGGHTP